MAIAALYTYSSLPISQHTLPLHHLLLKRLLSGIGGKGKKTCAFQGAGRVEFV